MSRQITKGPNVSCEVSENGSVICRKHNMTYIHFMESLAPHHSKYIVPAIVPMRTWTARELAMIVLARIEVATACGGHSHLAHNGYVVLTRGLLKWVSGA